MTKKLNRKDFFGITAASATTAASFQSSQANSLVSNPIIVENALPGNDLWFEPNKQARNREIEGYANKTSVNAGESISFYVNTISRSYRIEIYRLGWYGGAGGRLVRSAVTRTGVKQPIPTTNALTGLSECRWKSPYTITVPTTGQLWTSGVYLAKLTTFEGVQTHIPFVVRDDFRFADYLVQASVTTWQAYNNWGGKSLYEFNSTQNKRATHVSFNRPYSAYGSSDLVNEWSGWELNMLRFLEREGYDVAYCTNIDTHADPSLLFRAKAFLSSGHDEYWSAPMRNSVEDGRNQGKHLAFFGANCAYWQVRMEKGFDGRANRTMVCYKDEALDPYSRNPATSDLTTVRWRDPIISRPEETLIGVQFEYYPVNVDMVISIASHWALAGTGLVNGSKLTGLVGYEADRRTGIGPANSVVLAHSPLVDEFGQPGSSNMTIYQHNQGPFVFATGSIQWAWGLDDMFATWSHPNLVNPAAQQITRNILARFAQ